MSMTAREHLEGIEKILTFAMKFKDKMVKENLSSARTACPICKAKGIDALVRARLVKNRRFQHGVAIHLTCDNHGSNNEKLRCPVNLME